MTRNRSMLLGLSSSAPVARRSESEMEKLHLVRSSPSSFTASRFKKTLTGAVGGLRPGSL